MEKKTCFRKGEHLHLEGDQPQGIWRVLSGRIHIRKTSHDGRLTLIDSIEPGGVVCAAACLAKKSYPCAASADEDSVLEFVPIEDFLAETRRMPLGMVRILRGLAQNLCQAHQALAVRAGNVEQRLAALLLELDRRRHHLAIPYTREELAQMANTTPETCIRTLSPWRKSGVISGKRGSLQVLKPEALRQMVMDG